MKVNKFDLILFDADDTLFDFRKCQEDAFGGLAEWLQIENVAQAHARFYEINIQFWKKFELNQISGPDLAIGRFKVWLDELGLKNSPSVCNRFYLEKLSKQQHLLSGAVELCQILSKYVRMAIVTNGFASVQRPRMEKSPLSEYMEHIFISEECGYKKPERAIFDLALQKMNLEDRKRVLMVGDRIDVDVLGAQRAGIQACWVNYADLKTSGEIQPEFEVKSLLELQNLLVDH